MISSTSPSDRSRPTGALAPAGQGATRPPAARPDRVSTQSAAALQAALANQPEIRPEVVARARELARDPNYPSPEIIKKVAAVIVRAPDPSLDES